MSKAKINLIIDAILYLLLVAITGLGLLIKYVLVAGFERNEIYGSDVELYFLGLDRHQWGTIHLILGFGFVFFLLAHIVLHWAMIKCIYRKMFSNSIIRTSLAALLLVFTILIGVVPLFIQPKISDSMLHHRNNKNYGEIKHINTDDCNSEILQKDEFFNLNRTEKIKNRSLNQFQESKRNHSVNHEHNNIEVFGSFTLIEVAEKYKIPVSELAAVIKVPERFSNRRLGRLKREYDFDMDDLRDYISVNLSAGN
jgi:hypothetical protein